LLCAILACFPSRPPLPLFPIPILSPHLTPTTHTLPNPHLQQLVDRGGYTRVTSCEAVEVDPWLGQRVEPVNRVISIPSFSTVCQRGCVSERFPIVRRWASRVSGILERSLVCPSDRTDRASLSQQLPTNHFGHAENRSEKQLPICCRHGGFCLESSLVASHSRRTSSKHVQTVSMH